MHKVGIDLDINISSSLTHITLLIDTYVSDTGV